MDDFPILGLLTMMAIVILVIKLLWSHKVGKAWSQAAERLGLAYYGGGVLTKPTIRGELRGIPVVVDLHILRSTSGKTSRTTYYTDFCAELSAEWICGMDLTKRGFFDKVSEVFGGQDIEIGHAEFDKQFRVQGTVSETVKEALLREDAQAALQRLVNNFNRFQLDGGGLQARTNGRVANADTLTRLINTVVDAAQELNDAVAATESLEDEQSRAPDLFPMPAGPSESEAIAIGHDDEHCDVVW